VLRRNAARSGSVDTVEFARFDPRRDSALIALEKPLINPSFRPFYPI
jgi:hypothetical protein